MTDYVFLVGAPRSGTTWLQIMLSQHPHVSTCQETHLFSGFLTILQRHWQGFESNDRGIGPKAAIPYEKFTELRRHFALTVLNSIGDSPIILEKTPAHVRVLEDICEVLPEAKFIHIIRDPRAVAASLAAAGKGWGSRWATTSASRNAKLWLADVDAGTELRKIGSDKYYEVRYENFLSAPHQNLAQLFSWLQVDASEDLCAKIIESTQIEKLRNASEPAPWDLAKEPSGFYRKGQADSWKSELNAKDLAVIESVAGPLMGDLGYERATHGVPIFERLKMRAVEGLEWRLSKLVNRLGEY